MSGFTSLPGALEESMRPLLKEDVAFADEKMEDKAALDLVLQDVVRGEQYQATKLVQANQELADNIYRAYVKPRTWPGTDTQRANLGMPLVLETIDTNLLPALYMGFFSDKQPFLLDPKGRTKPAAARATAKVLCWELKETGFSEEIRKIAKSALVYGQGVGKWGWTIDIHRGKVYRRKAAPASVVQGPVTTQVDTDESDQVEAVSSNREIAKPTFEYVDLRDIIVAPGTRSHDIRPAKWVAQRFFIDAYELDDLADTDGYKNVPTREALREILTALTEPTTNSHAAADPWLQPELQAEQKAAPQSADPLLQPLEILEYWTADRVITVLQRKIVIRNDENEFGRLPFVSCSFIDVLNSWYGYGVAKLLGSEQLFEQGVVNSYIDGLALKLNPAFQRKNGLGATAQTILLSPGKVVNDAGELNPLAQDSISAEALEAIEKSESRAVRRVGAQGGDNMPTQAMRTAEGVQSFTSGVANRMQYFMEQFANLVFIPVLEAFIELAKEKLRPSQINHILSETDGQAYEGDPLEIYNGNYSLDVLTSTKLTARRAMANLLPMFIQLFQAEGVQDSLNVQAMKVDYAELVEQAGDLVGLDLSAIVVPQTQQDQQRASIEQQKAMAAAQMEQQKQNNADEQIDRQGEVKAGNLVVKHLLKEAENKNPVSSGDAATVGNEINSMRIGGL